MATTVTLNSDLIDEVRAITGKATKTEAVREALTEFVRSKRRQELLRLQGRIHIRLNNEEIEALEEEE